MTKCLHGNDCVKIKYSIPSPFKTLSGLEEAGSYSGEAFFRCNSKSARFVKCFIFCLISDPTHKSPGHLSDDFDYDLFWCRFAKFIPG